jgi:uncharacterized protein (TIGR02145 family)
MRPVSIPSFVFASALLLVACGKENPVVPGTSSSEISSSTPSSSVEIPSSSSVSSSVPYSSFIAHSSSLASSSNNPSSSSVSSSSKPSSSSVAPSSSSAMSSSVPYSSLITHSSSLSSSSSVPSSSSVVQSSSSWYPYNGSKSYGNYTDTRDGKVYKTLEIQGITIMAQNLNYGTQVNGTAAADDQDNDALVEKYCYNDNPAMCDKYGGLYQWAEAMALPFSCNSTTCASSLTANHQGICPTGWHVLVAADFQWISAGLGLGQEARDLKATIDWTHSSTGAALNGTGFTALPGGMRKQSSVGGYSYLNQTSYFWYATEYVATASKLFSMTYNSVSTNLANSYKTIGSSVRCVMNY